MTGSTAPTPTKLRLPQIPNAVKSCESALEEDPLHHYLRDTPDSDGRLWMQRWRIQLSSSLVTEVHRGRAWTVDNGDALMVSHSPNDVGDDIDAFLDMIIHSLVGITDDWLSSQQKRRSEELGEKLRKVLKATLGDRIKDMFYIAGLATNPTKQGRGYGSTLVNLAKNMADADHRETWLLSSNIANEEFYNFLGFITQAEIILGDDCTWKEPPVVATLMVREPVSSQ